MNVPATDRFTADHAADLYGLDAWGNGYLAVRDNGHLLVTPTRDATRGIDVYEVVSKLVRRGYNTPILLRFPQLLEGQIGELADAFAHAIREYKYPGRFLPVFPMKVNQQRPVVDELLSSGWKYGLGLEVGSRPELVAAAALATPPDALVVCNGFKDAEYLSSAAFAARLGKHVVVVVEKPFELDAILESAAAGESLPMIGFRIRLQARGSGLWEKSGGFASKFGLTTRQLLDALERLAAAGLQQHVALLHFHIGSQITEIRKVKNAVREGGRIYAKLRKLGVQIRYLDVGGGLGIDYDGSKTSSDASVNYTVQEYANDIVFGISEVCEEEHVEPPTIVCESGRMLTAYHAMLVTDVRAAISGVDPQPPVLTGREAQVVGELAEVDRNINVKIYREFYHDAIEYRDQMYSLFNLGMLGLEDRAKGESLFWSIAGKAVRHSKSAKFVAEEFQELESRLHDKYICNFSVFQSLPDHWALDQLFPVVPAHRLNEIPGRRATLVDITCDSDGEVSKFVDLKDIKEALEIHELVGGEPYYLAFVLVGAYQDTMGDLHNLFGRVHEADVILDPRGSVMLRDVRRGEGAVEALRYFGYHEEELVAWIEAALRGRVHGGLLSEQDAAALLEDYRRHLRRYTYLDHPR
jgi:arginine decarboxylase